MSQEGAEREGEAGRRGIAGVVGGRRTERTVQIDPWRPFGLGDGMGDCLGNFLGRGRTGREGSEL